MAEKALVVIFTTALALMLIFFLFETIKIVINSISTNEFGFAIFMIFLIAIEIAEVFGLYYAMLHIKETIATIEIEEPYIMPEGYEVRYKQTGIVLNGSDNLDIVLDPNFDSEWIYKELDADKVEICNDLTEFEISYMKIWFYVFDDEANIYYEIHIPENLELTELPQQ